MSSPLGVLRRLHLSESVSDLLPAHGVIGCRLCWDNHGSEAEFLSADKKFKLVNDPAAWGSREPRYLVLGITKGNTQSNAMRNAMRDGQFDLVAFKNFRDRLTTVLHIVGLAQHTESVDTLIVSEEQLFSWGSVIRCSLTGWDTSKRVFTGESGRVLPAFNHPEMQVVVRNCFSRFLSRLSRRTEIVVLLGNADGYMKKMKTIVEEAYRPDFSYDPEDKNVSYFAGGKLWVHVGHPSKGNGYYNEFVKGSPTSTQGEKREIAKRTIREVLDRGRACL
jgi:hypothetical protein